MSEPKLLRVKTIEVKGLFGRYHHKVNLNLNDRVTILHGPNGVGKTMLLRMADSLLKGVWGFLTQSPYDQFSVEFTDGSKLNLDRTKLLSIELTRPTASKPLTHQLPLPGLPQESLSATISVADYVNQFYSNNIWIEPKYSLSGFRSSPRWDDLISMIKDKDPWREPEWLTDFRNQIQCHLIETQRLLRLEPTDDEEETRGAKPQIVYRVKDYARYLAQRISSTTARYGLESQTLDQSYPQRVLSKKGGALDSEVLIKRLQMLDAKQKHLKDLGLLDKTTSTPFDLTALGTLDATERRAMSLYVQDTTQKLAILDDLADRIRLLLDNVNQKFRHKHIRIDREKGFIAEDDKGRPLDLDALSSGEQHELVLHYDLLFRVQPNTLVLIDEPELSLHVTWQKRFLPDMLEIVKTANFDMLLATHSPFIVGDRSDLMVALDDDEAK